MTKLGRAFLKTILDMLGMLLVCSVFVLVALFLMWVPAWASVTIIAVTIFAFSMANNYNDDK